MLNHIAFAIVFGTPMSWILETLSPFFQKYWFLARALRGPRTSVRPQLKFEDVAVLVMETPDEGAQMLPGLR